MTNTDVATCTECGLPIRMLAGKWIHLHIPHGAKHVPSPDKREKFRVVENYKAYNAITDL